MTASAVWLSEMGLTITLTRVQAYSTPAGTGVTVSQMWPLPQVEDIVIAPTRAARQARESEALPEQPWTDEDLRRLLEDVDNATVHATTDLCSEQPGAWLAAEEIQSRTGREPARHRGDYGGFGITVKHRSKRSNGPFQSQWAAGGTPQAYDRVDPDVAQLRDKVRTGASSPDPAPSTPAEVVDGQSSAADRPQPSTTWRPQMAR